MLSRFLPDSRGGRVAAVVALIAALLAGVAVGRIHAYNQSVGGMTAAFGGVIFFFAAVGFVAFAAVATLVSRVIRAPRGAAARLNGVVAVALVVGFGAGWATGEATPPAPVAPIHRESDGQTNATIMSTTATFAPRPDGQARCESVDDGLAVGVITALDLGDLNGVTLGAFIEPDLAVRTARLELFTDGAGLTKDTAPAWSATAALTATVSDGSTGTIEFNDLALPVVEGAPSRAAVWAGPLSGTISWTCEPWS